MAMLTLFCAILAFGILTSDATTQHMICATVNDVFSGEGTQQSVPRSIILPVVAPSPVGKLGPRGEKGDPGSAGVPGTVNQRDLETLIDEKVNEATATFREEVEKLQRDVDKCNVTEVPSTTPETCNCNVTDPCTDGFLYHEMCYFAAIVNDGSVYVDFTKAKQLCIDRGGKIADVFNLEHQEMVEDELRKDMEGNYLEIWTATTYSPSTRTLHMTNGTTMNAGSFRWYSIRFPTSVRYHLNLVLHARPYPRPGGIFNQRGYYKARGGFCVK